MRQAQNPLVINNGTAVHAQSEGTLKTDDICLTGPNKTAVHYTNIAKTADITDCATCLYVKGNPVAHKNSYISQSTGDEAGDGKGQHSGSIQGPAHFVTASQNVFVENKALVRSFDLMTSNNKNTPPAPLVQ